MRSPLTALLVGSAVSVALVCASGAAPPAAPQETEAEGQAAPEEPQETRQSHRLGLWEFDLLALDREPRGTTFRMLDFKILKVLEIGRGAKYHSFSFIEIPELLNLVTTRREGPDAEHRFADVQALSLAVMRMVEENASPPESELHLLKIPVVGSLYGQEVSGAAEMHRLLYLFSWETESAR
jgi:hypothetical protein